MRFNLSNSQKEIFERTWDLPNTLPPNSIPAQKTQSVSASWRYHPVPPPALGSGQLRVIVNPMVWL